VLSSRTPRHRCWASYGAQVDHGPRRGCPDVARPTSYIFCVSLLITVSRGCLLSQGPVTPALALVSPTSTASAGVSTHFVNHYFARGCRSGQGKGDVRGSQPPLASSAFGSDGRFFRWKTLACPVTLVACPMTRRTAGRRAAVRAARMAPPPRGPVYPLPYDPHPGDVAQLIERRRSGAGLRSKPAPSLAA